MSIENPEKIILSAEENPEQQEKIAEIIADVKDGLNVLINEAKDLKSLPRYILLRPFRGIPWTEDNLRSVLNRSRSGLTSFCKQIGEKSPQILEEYQALLEKMDSPEMKERIQSAYK